MGVRSQVLRAAQGFLDGKISPQDLLDLMDRDAAEIVRLGATDPARLLAGIIEVTGAEMDDGLASAETLRQRVDDFLCQQPSPLTASNSGQS